MPVSRDACMALGILPWIHAWICGWECMWDIIKLRSHHIYIINIINSRGIKILFYVSEISVSICRKVFITSTGRDFLMCDIFITGQDKILIYNNFINKIRSRFSTCIIILRIFVHVVIKMSSSVSWLLWQIEYSVSNWCSFRSSPSPYNPFYIVYISCGDSISMI